MFNKTVKHNIAIPSGVENIAAKDLSLPYNKVEGAKERILLLFDYSHRTDSAKSKLLSGLIGDFLKMVDGRAKKSIKQSLFTESVFSINYHHFYEVRAKDDETDDDDESSGGIEATIESLNKKRVLDFIAKVKPTRIICFGTRSFKALQQFYTKSYLQQMAWTSLLGVPKKVEIESHACVLVPMLNPNTICQYTTTREPYLIGYFCRNWENAVLGKIRFDAQVRARNVEVVYVDTIKKFDKLMEILRKKEIVAIDTESNNLNRVANSMLSIQFAFSKDKGYFLPYKHFDTPFTGKELKHIEEKLKEYFLENENKLHLYCNANFDIPLIRKELKLPFYKNDIWDVQAGEYALDENIVELANVTSKGYYNLGNLSVQYGFDGYHSGKFGKEDRVGISKVPLDTPGLLNYGCYDVTVLVGIREQQLLRAAAENHVKYPNVVANLIGDTIHTFATMNVNGILVDQPYLWGLSAANSPISEEVRKMEDVLLGSNEVRLAEKVIGTNNKVPTQTLFGSAVTRSIFSLRKKAHLRALFFDVMKLAPVNEGADGPSLDKEFQEEYRDNAIVSAYTSLNKAKKIRDAFVKSLIKIVSKNEDAKLTGRIRSFYKYLQVVTGRTSSTEPNLQQVPAHGKLAGYIKRAFVASPGTLFIKVDYSAHEVRGLALVGNDKVLAGAFQRGLDLYQEYLKNPTPLALKKHAEEGDIHIINACFFFGLKPHEVTKVIRQSVKAVVFGLIYGRSAPSIAAALGRPLEEVEDVMKKFFARFKDGAKWLKGTVEFARKNAYVEAPTGLRRHLWPYLLPVTPQTKKSFEPISAACDRRANNSPIQGMGSGIGYSAARYLEEWTFKRFRKWSIKNGKLPIRNQNMVHDSMEHEVEYSHIGYALEMIQESLTVGVQGKCIEKFGMKFPVDLSIEMDVGSALDNVEKWDGSIQSLHALIEAALIFQRDVMKYDVDVEKVLHQIFTGYLPPFLMEQARRGYFTFAEKYGMEVDKKIAKATHAELERQAKELAEKKAAEAAESEKKKAAEEKAKEAEKLTKDAIDKAKKAKRKASA